MEEENEVLTENIVGEELRKRCFNFFKNNNINLPIEVSNALNDVFDENDFTSDEEDVINIYFKEDIEDFQRETMIYNTLNVQVKGGNSSGDLFKKFTYWGELSTKNAYSENIGLYDGEEVVMQQSLIEATESNKLEDPEDFSIIVLEEYEFHMGEYTVIPRLYIYVPQSGENI